jgi:hypothetical protein
MSERFTDEQLREWIDEHTRAPWITVERKHPRIVHGETLLSLLSELLALRETKAALAARDAEIERLEGLVEFYRKAFPTEADMAQRAALEIDPPR